MVSKGFLKPEDICKVDLEASSSPATRKRTSEVLLHLAIYKQRPDVGACVHCHPPHATPSRWLTSRFRKCILRMVEVFLGEVPIAVYETPGGQKFADTVAPFAKDANTSPPCHHGTITFGRIWRRRTGYGGSRA